MIGRAILAIAAIAAVGCRPAQEPQLDAAQATTRPNVLFLFADDQRADTIAAWGNPNIRTPNLDRLAAAGFSFRNNYNLGSSGGAVCVPSRAMLNTGRAYFRAPNDLRGATLLPELLGESGYSTFATGKWHNGEESWLRGFQHGQALFFGGMSDHNQVPLVDLVGNGELGNERVGHKLSSELFADAAIEFLESYRGEQPFYAYVAFTAPHDPRMPPQEFRDYYYENPPPLPDNFLPLHPFNLGRALAVRDEQLAAWPRVEEIIGDQIAEYYRLITHLDGQIVRILDALQAGDHADNTIVVYAADHGLAMGSHGLLGKQNVYEHSQMCPLIFAGPNIPHGESEAFTYLLDIFPTVTALTGAPTPAGLDGADLAGIWRVEATGVRDSVFLAYTRMARSVRNERYKLIRYPQVDETQLFDLVADPAEIDNLSADPEHAGLIDELTALLVQWQRRLGDTQPVVVDDPQPREIDSAASSARPTAGSRRGSSRSTSGADLVLLESMSCGVVMIPSRRRHSRLPAA